MGSKTNKNPLYVVKDDHVSEANGPLDFIIKKLNLEPLMKIFEEIIQTLIQEFQGYTVIEKVKEMLNNLINSLKLLTVQFGLSS